MKPPRFPHRSWRPGPRLAACLGILLAAGCAGGPETPAPTGPEAGEAVVAVQPAQPVQPVQPEPPPVDAVTLRRQAADALAEGRLPEAQEASARALEMEPYQPESLLLRARVLAASGTWPQALRLLELEPVAGLADAILLRAEILAVHAREEQQALELLRGARASRDARLAELEGRILLSTGRESEGREALLRALELEPDREPTLRLLLEQAVRAEAWEEAAGYLERLDAAEGSETDQVLAYRVQARLGRTGEALALAARLYAARPEAYAVEYASALLDSGDWEQALRVVDQHLGTPAPLLSSRLLVVRAQALESRDPDLAMDALQQALTLDPANFPALVHLGELYAARQDYRRARQYLRLALELDPTNAELSARLEGLNY